MLVLPLCLVLCQVHLVTLTETIAERVLCAFTPKCACFLVSHFKPEAAEWWIICGWWWSSCEAGLSLQCPLALRWGCSPCPRASNTLPGLLTTCSAPGDTAAAPLITNLTCPGLFSVTEANQLRIACSCTSELFCSPEQCNLFQAACWERWLTHDASWTALETFLTVQTSSSAFEMENRLAAFNLSVKIEIRCFQYLQVNRAIQKSYSKMPVVWEKFFGLLFWEKQSLLELKPLLIWAWVYSASSHPPHLLQPAAAGFSVHACPSAEHPPASHTTAALPAPCPSLAPLQCSPNEALGQCLGSGRHCQWGLWGWPCWWLCPWPCWWLCWWLCWRPCPWLCWWLCPWPCPWLCPWPCPCLCWWLCPWLCPWPCWWLCPWLCPWLHWWLCWWLCPWPCCPLPHHPLLHLLGADRTQDLRTAWTASQSEAGPQIIHNTSYTRKQTILNTKFVSGVETGGAVAWGLLLKALLKLYIFQSSIHMPHHSRSDDKWQPSKPTIFQHCTMCGNTCSNVYGGKRNSLTTQY